MDPVLSRKLKVLNWFAILLVVWVHAFNFFPRYLVPNTLVEGGFNFFSYVEYLISNGMARFVMPFFFAVSGFLFFFRTGLDKPPFASKILGRVRTVAIPYLIWNCIGIAVVVAARNLQLSQEFMPQYLKEMTWEQFASGFILGPVSFQLWYLRDLFLLCVLSPIIFFICRYRAGALIWLVLLLVVWSHDNSGPKILNAEGVLFFSFGAAIAIHKIRLWHPAHLSGWLAMAGVWLALSLLRAWIAFDTVPMAQTWLLILYKVCVLIGLWVVWTGYDFLVGDVSEQSALWPWLTLSFYIFVMHQPLYNIVSDNILGRIGHHELLKQINPSGAFLVYLLLPIATVVFCSLLGMLIRAYAKPLHRVLTGGR
jgi:fucose 4-O-acetylase-like acetyltransferase